MHRYPRSSVRGILHSTMNAASSTASWLSLDFPPFRLEPLEVRLKDSRVTRAVWTGARWWSEGREVQAEAWRPVSPELGSPVR
jgi:hypothetical protein